jgi:hypothetical protein
VNHIKETAKGLHELAHVLESLDGDDEIFGHVQYNMFVDTPEQLRDLVRQIGGFSKQSIGDFLVVRKTFSGGVELDVNINHKNVCERVETLVTIPARPETVVPAQPERTEVVTSWKCPESVLAGS